MKISKHELESMIKEELAKEEITEASLNPFKRAHDRGQQTGLGWRAKLGKFFGLDSPSDEPAPTTTPSTSSADKTLPISASEMKIIQQVGIRRSE